MGSIAHAQATGTPTPTPTSTPTITPTLDTNGQLANQAPCPTASTCDYTTTSTLQALPGTRGNKTVAVTTTAGTATTDLYCHVSEGYLAPDIKLASLTGATCTTAANCVKEFTTYCETVWLKLSACNACTVSAWLRVNP